MSDVDETQSDVMPLTNYQEACAEIERLAGLAALYLEDGAPRTAAARFRAAADRCEDLAALREAAMPIAS